MLFDYVLYLDVCTYVITLALLRFIFLFAFLFVLAILHLCLLCEETISGVGTSGRGLGLYIALHTCTLAYSSLTYTQSLFFSATSWLRASALQAMYGGWIRPLSKLSSYYYICVLCICPHSSISGGCDPSGVTALAHSTHSRLY